MVLTFNIRSWKINKIELIKFIIQMQHRYKTNQENTKHQPSLLRTRQQIHDISHIINQVKRNIDNPNPQEFLKRSHQRSDSKDSKYKIHIDDKHTESRIDMTVSISSTIHDKPYKNYLNYQTRESQQFQTTRHWESSNVIENSPPPTERRIDQKSFAPIIYSGVQGSIKKKNHKEEKKYIFETQKKYDKKIQKERENIEKSHNVNPSPQVFQYAEEQFNTKFQLYQKNEDPDDLLRLDEEISQPEIKKVQSERQEQNDQSLDQSYRQESQIADQYVIVTPKKQSVEITPSKQEFEKKIVESKTPAKYEIIETKKPEEQLHHNPYIRFFQNEKKQVKKVSVRLDKLPAKKQKEEDLFTFHKNIYLQKLRKEGKERQRQHKWGRERRSRSKSQKRTKTLSPELQRITNRLYNKSINKQPCLRYMKHHKYERKAFDILGQYSFLTRYLTQREVEALVIKYMHAGVPQYQWPMKIVNLVYDKKMKI